MAIFLGVVFAIVYTGEHYVVDAIAGAAYALAAWWLVERLLAFGRPSVEPAGVKVAAGRADG